MNRNDDVANDSTLYLYIVHLCICVTTYQTLCLFVSLYLSLYVYISHPNAFHYVR